MGVLLGLGDVQLALAALGEHLGQRRLRLVRRERDRVGPLGPVAGQRDQLELGGVAAVELVEVPLGERHHQLAGAVGAEVEVEDDVAVGGAVVVADHGRLDELVGLAALVGLGDRLGRGRRVQPLGVDDRVVGELGPLPAAVAVHRVVAARDRPHAPRVPQPALELRDVAGGRGGQRVAPVGERVHDQVRHPLLSGELDQRLDVRPARVHAAVRDQPDQVQAPARAAAGCVAGGQQHLVLEQRAVGDRVVDPRQVLLHDRSRAQVQVADLGVAHLPLGQADVAPARRQGRARVAPPELVEDRGLGERDGVARPGLRQPPAVEDHEGERGHRDRSAPRQTVTEGPSTAARLGFASLRLTPRPCRSRRSRPGRARRRLPVRRRRRRARTARPRSPASPSRRRRSGSPRRRRRSDPRSARG